jgi:N-acylglucosamine 2-epimerase
MIDINLCEEMKEALPDLDVEERVQRNIDEFFKVFLNEPEGFCWENVALTEEGRDTFEGRLVNPGHSLEGLWFIMFTANKRGLKNLVDQAAKAILKTLEYGWDKVHGGIFYFLDSKGKPPQQLEWDQKLWWVHLEALVAVALAFKYTGDAQFAEWYFKLHEWAWKRFPDPPHGEWFGYLNREGKPLLELKVNSNSNQQVRTTH